MKRRAGTMALVALCGVQLAVILSMVMRYETTLHNGTPFRVRVEPVDPEDPFQGRYLRIVTRLEASMSEEYPWGRRLYAGLETGEDGFARVVSLSDSPLEGGNYVEVTRAAWWPGLLTTPDRPAEPEEPAGGAVPDTGAARSESSAPGGVPKLSPHRSTERIFVSLYCDRFYVTEAEAPAIEARYREAMKTPGGSKAWIGIRVRNGMAVIESLSTGP